MIMEGQNNMEEPLKSSLSIKIFRDETTKLLSAMLNPPKVISTNKGLSRNWKGLAELCSIEPVLIPSLECKPDPTQEVLKIWQRKRDESTIRQLINNLEELDRFDVIDDIAKSIGDDIHYHNQHPNGPRKQIPQSVLTVDDVENSQCVLYDAFVLFDYDDINFATEVVVTMEQRYNLKLCVKDRDLFVGTFEYEAIVKLISERCEKLLVILSPSFFCSPWNKFFLNFTQALSLDKRKVIPCLYKQCPDMPPEIRCYFMLDYTKSSPLWNFWDKLFESIRTEKAPPNASNRVLHSEQPSRPLIKTNSQRDTDVRLRLPNQVVRYNSLVELPNAGATEILTETSLVPSTSANSLVPSEKKNKPKKNWLQKILPKNLKNYKNCSQHINANGDAVNGRQKKSLWQRHVKRKVEVAT